jgi:hypothetical protein
VTSFTKEELEAIVAKNADSSDLAHVEKRRLASDLIQVTTDFELCLKALETLTGALKEMRTCSVKASVAVADILRRAL